MMATQWLVVTWVESVFAAAAVLVVALVALRWVTQPAERIRLIQIAIVMGLAAPALVVLSPLTVWRWKIMLPNAAAAHVLEPRISGSGVGSMSFSHLQADVVPVVGNDVATVKAGDDEFQAASPVTVPPATRVVTPSPWPDFWAIAALTLIGAQTLATVFLIVEGVIGLTRLRRLVWTTSPADDELLQLWHRVTDGRGEHVRLRISSEIGIPLVFGWRRPTVLVPSSIAEGDAKSLQFCLAHEWSHIVRGDMRAWWLTWLCQFGLWYQPAFWHLRRELRIAQDLLADDRAAAAGQDAIEYAELLVDLARQRLVRPLIGAMGFLDQSSQVSRRVTVLLTAHTPWSLRCSRRFTTAAVASAALSAAMFCGIRLEEVAAGNDPEPKAAPLEKPAPEAESKSPPVVTKPAETLHYFGVILDKDSGKPLPKATVTVRRSALTSMANTLIEESKHTTDANGKYTFDIPPEQVAERYLYIELDVEHADYAARKGFGYALSMIRKNETLGERPFFERVELDAADPVMGTVLAPDGRPLAGIKIQGYSKRNASDFRDYGSFVDTLTDADGKFSLNLVKGGVGVFWVLPKDYASTSRAVSPDRGDVGEIRLRDGVRVAGRVLSADGNPLAGVPVNIDYTDGGNETVNNLPVASSIRRSAISAADGSFTFDPLPSGNYRVIPDEHRHDPIIRDRTQYKLPGVFLPMKVTLQDGVAVQPIEVQAVPHVVFHAQILDSAGMKTRGHAFHIFGQMDGQYWFGQGRPDSEGTIALPVPHGLQSVRVELSTNEHGALRFRRGPGKELENRQDDIDFGTMNDDVEGFEIVRYKAPLVLIAAVDEAGQSLKKFSVTAKYPWGRQRYVLEGELSSDLSFEHQDDGRYRTSQMLPDEDVTFTVVAPGYESATQKVRLTEGEQKELTVTLKQKVESPAETMPE